MYMELNGKELKKNWKKLNEKAKEDYSENDEELKNEPLLEPREEQEEIHEVNFDKDGNLQVSLSTKYGYFSFEIEIDDNTAFEIIDYMKNKGEKIRRLVKLAEGEE